MHIGGIMENAKKWYEEDEAEEADVYDESWVEELLESDSISPEEAAFMHGYDG